ncbi:MAG: DNA cytosine methyltransferase, partial [bacterium]|nr:DNA cytosine methyltransferase [bacterium]
DGSASSSGDAEDSSAIEAGGEVWPQLRNQWVGQLPRACLARLVQRFSQRPLRVSLPCAGMDAPGQALRLMGINYELVGAWEVDVGIGQILEKLYAARVDRCNVHVGPESGDILRVVAGTVPPADALFSGPPCPPWSAIGRRGARDDVRSKVFDRVVEWIIELAPRGLSLAVLENVAGILERKGRKEPRHVDRYLGKLQRHLPSWSWSTLRLNSQDFGVPHHRVRVYLVGVAQGERIVRVPRFTGQTLHELCGKRKHGRTRADVKKLPPNQRRNLQQWKSRLRGVLQDTALVGGTASFEVDRNPCKSNFASCRTDGSTPCLRASGHDLWLLGLGEGRRPAVNRLLLTEERCLLQGMCPRSIQSVGAPTRVILRGLGNAMTVPVVGATAFAALASLDDAGAFVSEQSSSSSGSSYSSSGSSSSSS